MRSRSAASFCLLLSLAAPAGARAEEEAGSRAAIQRRKYQMSHELRVALGSMPLDAFEKGWTAGLAYTVHYGGDFAWEVFHVAGALLRPTGLQDDLIDTFAVPEDDFAAPRFLATTGVEIAPLYGKQAIFNGPVIHQSVHLGLHAGAFFGDRGSLGDTLGDLRPTAGVGIGYRVFFSPLFSLRGDLRDFLSLRRPIDDRPLTIENVLLLSLSLSFNLWRDDA